jgi:hypothetical protein
MSRITDEHSAVVDAFAHLGADIVAAPDDPAVRRLRALLANALRAQLEFDPSLKAMPPAEPGRIEAVPESVRARLIADAEALDAHEAGAGPTDETLAATLLVHRRDPRAIMQSGALDDHLPGLVPAETLGPWPLTRWM